MYPNRTYRSSPSGYRLDLLPVIPPFHLRARRKGLKIGELVYYGPMPLYYGIGEVVKNEDRFVVVDFRGTGQFSVHQEAMEAQYLIPVPPYSMALL